MQHPVLPENALHFQEMYFTNGCQYRQPKNLIYTLLYVMRGEMHVTLRETTYVVYPGEAMFIPVGNDGCFLDYRGRPYYGLTLRFRSFPNAAYYDYPAQIISLDAEGRRFLEDIPCATAISEAKIWRFYRALAYLQARMHRNNHRHVDLVDKALDYMMTHTAYDVATLAKLCCVSESGFRAIFQSVTGESFLSKKHSIQAFQAELLLHSTDLSIDEIARRVGFASTQHFRKIFQSRYNTTPNRFRKQRNAPIPQLSPPPKKETE